MFWETFISLAFAFDATLNGNLNCTSSLTSQGAAPSVIAEKSVSAMGDQKSAGSGTAALRLEFTSNENFTGDLANSSSLAFQDRVNLMKTQLTPVFQNAFSSFLQLTGVRFSEDMDSGEGSGSGFGGGSGSGSGQKSKILVSVHGFSFMGEPGGVLVPEEDIRNFDNEHIFSFRIDATEVLNRPLVTTADLVFNSSGIVPRIDQVVKTLKQAINDGTVTIPIILSSINATNVTPAIIAPPTASGTPTGPPSSGVSPVPPSVFSCFLLAWCSLLLGTVLNLS